MWVLFALMGNLPPFVNLTYYFEEKNWLIWKENG